MKKNIFKVIIILILLTYPINTHAMEKRVVYEDIIEKSTPAKIIDVLDKETNIKYSLYIPKQNRNKYMNKSNIPIIFAYHGIGKWETDSSINFALYSMCKTNTIQPKCYIVFVQDWYNYNLKLHKTFIKNILKSYEHINLNKVYFYGFSYGAYKSINMLKLYNFRGAAFNDGCPAAYGSTDDLISLNLKAIWACDSAEYQETYWNNVKEKGNYNDSNFFYKHITFNGKSDHAGVNGWAVAENNNQLPWQSLNNISYGENCDFNITGNCINWLLSK